MNKEPPVIYLARDGKTVWSIFGQHTGRGDLPLGERGENNARRLGDQFRERRFAREITSPSQRTCRTGELAGFHDQAKTDSDLHEWNYGEYDGLETADVHAERPAWQLFCDGRPGGESAGEVGAPADRVVDGAGPTRRDVFDFLERALSAGAGWTLAGMSGRQMVPAEHGKRESALSYEHDLSQPAVRLLNDLHHLMYH